MNFDLDDRGYVELNNLLKLTGLCDSGGQSKLCISNGEVKVDGQVETRKRCKIRSGQSVEFSGQTVAVK